MSDPYRAVVRAVVELSTQVQRIADAMTTPVARGTDTPTTTPDNGLRLSPWLPVPEPDQELRALIDAMIDRARTPPTSVPTCGASTGGVFGRHLGPCTLRAGHTGFHQDSDREAWATRDDDDASVSEVERLRRDNAQLLGEQAACIEAEQQRDRLANVLRDVLACFTHETHPGQRCLQSGHVPVATVEKWRAALPPQP